MRPSTRPQHHPATRRPRTVSVWRSATCYLLFPLILTACGADHRARNLIAQYKVAVEKHDIPLMVKLSDPNMRASIERGNLRQDAVLACIDGILQHPVRVVGDGRGIVYLGWVPAQPEMFTLTQVVVGEGRTITKYSALRDSPGGSDTTDWQVSVMGEDEWALLRFAQALAKVDDSLLKAWYFDGSYDAKHELKRLVDVH
jgi:hypothetical protein